jgi:type IV pilus assembly protein PilQ
VNAPVGNPIGTFRVGTSGPGGNLDVALEALASKNKAHIISNPRITTLDNQSARILVGKKIPLIVSDAAGNPITQLTTIGIQMTVVPHVNSNNMITMDLHPEVSDLSSQATVQGGIIIVTSEAATRVMVNDGETAVIGGLIRSNEAEREDGVPLLKDIPLFGNLFKSSNTTKESRELLILVTPRIVRDVGMGGSGTGEAPEEPEG